MRLWRWLTGLWWRSRPRCAEAPPWRLADAGPCILPRSRHEWHGDGQGFIWNATRWQWMGPVIRPNDEWADYEYREPPAGSVEEYPGSSGFFIEHHGPLTGSYRTFVVPSPPE